MTETQEPLVDVGAVTKATFTMRSRNPDVLSCIANLSNDEVFTPPEFANRMLDTLAEGWAAANDGADIWADSKVTFLDPFTKSGVFLREITKRLVAGLAGEIPDLEQRVDHILTKQVFGIAITEITALLARRSLYCSKLANGPHSIAKSFGEGDGFGNADGHIWFERTDHTWVGGTEWVYTADETGNQVKRFTNGKCAFCGASRGEFERSENAETHAYALLHAANPRSLLSKIFGDEVKFDVVVGNPPYQINSDGNSRTIPIYHKFINAALSLEPRFVTMVTPSRWFAGGLGLNEFRAQMLSDRRLRVLKDFPNAGDVFPGVDIKGGVNYFLFDTEYSGDTEHSIVRGDKTVGPFQRRLDRFDILIRDPRAEAILDKVLDSGDASIDAIVHTNNEFGLGTNFRDYKRIDFPGSVRLHLVDSLKRVTGYIRPDQVPRGAEWLDCWKVVVPKSGSDGGVVLPDPVLGKPFVSAPGAAVTQTYVFLDADSEESALSIESYMRTRFFRFLVSLRKINQHAPKPTYQWVPMQTWDREWTDAALFAKYALTADEQDYVAEMIREMAAAS